MKALFLLLLTAALPAQIPFDVVPLSVAVIGGDLVAVNSDHSMTFVDIEGLMNGDPVTTQSVEQLPELKAEWVDAKGVKHSVTTPVVGGTDAQFAKTLKKHVDRVNLLQKVYPPCKI